VARAGWHRPPSGGGLPSESDFKEAEMYGNEMGKARIDDMVRSADAYRLAKQTRAGRAAAHRSLSRRISNALVAAVVWPVRH
jgi:hypothetical protein